MKNTFLSILFIAISLTAFSQSSELAQLRSSEKPENSQVQKTDILKLRKQCSKLVKSHIVRNFEYPQYLLENSIEGVVKMEILIDKKGLIKEVKFLKSPHSILSDSLRTFLHKQTISSLNTRGNELKTHVSLKYSLTPF